MVTADNITDAQIRKVLAHARRIKNVSLASCAMRALDGDSLYNRGLRERCAKTLNEMGR